MSSLFDQENPTTEWDAVHYDLGLVTVMELSGECDLVTRDVLELEIATILANRPDSLVVDLSGVEFCDAGCAGLLLNATQRVPIALAGANEHVVKVFDLLDPDGEMPRFHTVLAAARHHRQRHR